MEAVHDRTTTLETLSRLLAASTSPVSEDNDNDTALASVIKTAPFDDSAAAAEEWRLFKALTVAGSGLSAVKSAEVRLFEAEDLVLSRSLPRLRMLPEERSLSRSRNSCGEQKALLRCRDSAGGGSLQKALLR